MNKTLIDCDSLGNCLGSVVAALIVRQVKGLQGAVVTLEVLRNCLTTSEGDLIGVQVEHLKGGVFEQMFHDDVEAIVSKLMFPHGDFLETNVILKHFTEVNGDTLADGFVDWVFDIELFKSVVTGVEHTQDTNDTIMINFIVSQVQRK
jgi:hypothetical protein